MLELPLEAIQEWSFLLKVPKPFFKSLFFILDLNGAQLLSWLHQKLYRFKKKKIAYLALCLKPPLKTNNLFLAFC